MRHSPLGQRSARSNRPGRLRYLAAAAVLPLVAIASASPAHAQDEPFSNPSEAAAGWLASQAEGPSWSAGDVSSTLDVLIGLMAARVGGEKVQTSLEWLNEPDVLNAYVYPPGDESEDPQLNAGGAGKVMYVVATAGGDPADFGGVKLADAVTDSQRDDGHFGDGTPFATAWAVLGLSRSGQPANEEAAAALTAAQCPDGGYSFADADGGDDCASDPDTTGVVASALQTMDGDDAEAAHDAAIAWLESAQGENGGFDAGFGPNANSTAYAAQALLGAERAESAERATAFLIGLQVGCGEEAAGAIRATDPEDEEYGEMMRLSATAQALIPLSGQNLAELDASESDADLPVVQCEAVSGGETTGADGGEDGAASDEGSGSLVPWLVGGAAVVLAAIVLYVLARVRRGASTGDKEAE
ncbi:hypothetical protein GCM10027447_16430 [Glycomyces halotolerans]